MIIVDYSRLSIAGVLQQLKGAPKIELDLARHFILNMVQATNAKFRGEFGELVFAVDNRKYWRRDAFPYYKFKRKEGREASGIDWEGLYSASRTVKEELIENFPYRVIDVEGAEADDVIGVLCHEFGNTAEPILIVAEDGDFHQLHEYMNVKQWSPLMKKMRQINDPKGELLEKIIKGDKKDGVPNIKSNDDHYAVGAKTPKMTAKFVAETLKAYKEGKLPVELKRNWARNELLLDLSKIPPNIKFRVMNSYESQAGKDRSKIMNYLVEKRLRVLLDAMQNF